MIRQFCSITNAENSLCRAVVMSRVMDYIGEHLQGNSIKMLDVIEVYTCYFLLSPV